MVTEKYRLNGGYSGGTAYPTPILALRSVGRGNIFFRRSCSLAEEERFHLLDDYFLILLAGGVQPIFVQQHFAEFHPLVPCLLRDVLVDPLAKFAVERRFGKTRKLLFQFRAKNRSLGHKIFF